MLMSRVIFSICRATTLVYFSSDAKFVQVVAIGALLVGRDPVGLLRHLPDEFRHVQVREHLHVLVDVLRERRFTLDERQRRAA